MMRIVIIALSITLAIMIGFFVGARFFPFEAGLSDTQRMAAAEKLMGMSFTDEERELALEDVLENRRHYGKIRQVSIPNPVPPALEFNPVVAGPEKTPPADVPLQMSTLPDLTRPGEIEELAFATVRELAERIRTRQVTSEELTRMYLDRLKRYDPELHCVISLTENLALEQARRADQEIAQGIYRGPLHGVPYGLKDLFAVRGTKTTWGAKPYQDQVINQDATVFRRLSDAGAVLVAKLSSGALAWGDVWYGEKTRNPWDTQQGSSGSSAGPASATAAGLVAFAIGTETWGSIVSPSTRCGTTGLRPTFGRVSRAGGMNLAWSMDKVGPICRAVEDCALVLDAIRGADGFDREVVDRPFPYTPSVELKSLRIGYVKKLFEADYDNRPYDEATLSKLRDMGVQLVEIELPDLPVGDLAFILNAEAAAAFDEMTRFNLDDQLVRQVRMAWPNVFRTARYIPAVEYIQANRLRYLVMERMKDLFAGIDVYIVPTYGGDNLLMNNLTGHPAVVLPNGFDDKSHPVSICFVGDLYDEATLLAVAKAYQDATSFHQQRPARFAVSR